MTTIRYGTIERIKRFTDKNCAVVNYENEDDALNALTNLQNTILSGLKIHIAFASVNDYAPTYDTNGMSSFLPLLCVP